MENNMENNTSGMLRSPQRNKTRMLVYGALALALAFVLSYVRLIRLPFAGSLTLGSMLPICLFAAIYGPGPGFLAAFAYGLLQFVQDAYVIHPVQFVLDFILAFTSLGLASLFPKRYVRGMAVSGFARMLCSTVSGAVFFASYAAEAGFESAWLYSIAYNGCTIGADTLLCMLLLALPPVKMLIERLEKSARA